MEVLALLLTEPRLIVNYYFNQPITSCQLYHEKSMY